MTRVRLATLDDVPAILAISNHYAVNAAANFAHEPEPLAMWEESWRTTNEVHPWLVATDAPAGTVIGFAKSSPWKGRCAYHWTAEASVYLHPDHRGLGVGRALYDRLIEIMRVQGWRTLIGGITQPNAASVRLHESCGFHKVAHFERVGWKFNQWWDVGYWEVHLRETTEAPAAIRHVRDVMNQLSSEQLAPTR